MNNQQIEKTQVENTEIATLLFLAHKYADIYDRIKNQPDNELKTFKQFKDYTGIDTDFPRGELPKVRAMYRRYTQIRRLQENYNNQKPNILKNLYFFRRFTGVLLDEEFYSNIRVAFGPLSVDFFLTRKAFFNYLEKIDDNIFKNSNILGVSGGKVNIIVVDNDEKELFLSNFTQNIPINTQELQTKFPQLYSTLLHERQHSIYNLLHRSNCFLSNAILFAKQSKIFEKFLKLVLNIPRLRNFVEDYIIHTVIEQTKNELLAFLSGEHDIDYIKKHLLHKLKISTSKEGKVNSYHYWLNEVTLPIKSSIRIAIEHNRALIRAMKVINTLNSTYSLPRVITILTTINLNNWEQIAEALLDTTFNRRDRYLLS